MVLPCHQSFLPEKGKKIFQSFLHKDTWVPISLFAISPSLSANEWVAQNLCTLNSTLDKHEKFYGLGFISKAFGLWFANVRQCIGMTQWNNSALKTHCKYGILKLISAYIPIHSHPNTMTYQCNVDDKMWPYFFQEFPSSLIEDFKANYKFLFSINPQDTRSQILLQNKLIDQKSPIYLNSWEIGERNWDASQITLWEKRNSYINVS